jgi:hypothetical protein
MGIRILSGYLDGSHVSGACLYCSTSMTAFGPIFEDEFEAEAFVKWLPNEPDPRQYSSEKLDDLYCEWRNLKEQLEKKKV